MRKLLFLCLCVIVCSLTSCKTTDDTQMTESERREMIVSEYNNMTAVAREQVNQAKETANKYGNALMDLYLFDVLNSDLDNVFAEMETKTIEGANEAGASTFEESFYDMVNSRLPADTYDKYLYNFAERKGVKVSELKDKVKQWSELSESEQTAIKGTSEDFGVFALLNAVVVEHDFYTMIGAETVTEVYLFVGENTQQLSVFVTWQDGKILDVTRMYNS